MSDVWLASYVLLWVAVVALAVIVVGLLRQLGLLQLRLGPEPGPLLTKEGLERGVPAPDFAALDVRTNQTVTLERMRGRRVLLVFMTPTCIACRQLAPHLNGLSGDKSRPLEVAVVCHGSSVTCSEFANAYRLKVPVLLDATNTVAAHYDVRMTPFAFLLGEDGVVRIRGVVNSLPQLEALLDEEGTVNPTPYPLAPDMPNAVTLSIPIVSDGGTAQAIESQVTVGS